MESRFFQKKETSQRMQWACQEKVVPCPEGPFFTADRSGTKSPLDSPLDSAVQRETVIVSQNDSSKRLLFDSANDDSAKRFLFCSRWKLPFFKKGQNCVRTGGKYTLQRPKASTCSLSRLQINLKSLQLRFGWVLDNFPRF